MPYGKINGMRLTLDKSGGCPPKPLRQRLGLRAGATLEVAEAAGAVAAPCQPAAFDGGTQRVLVHTGQERPR